MRALHVEKGLLRRLYGNMKGNKENHKLLQLLLAIFIFRGKPFQPLFPMHFTPQKKREGNCLVYFRFLTIQKPTIIATAMIIAATRIAISVFMKGAFVDSGTLCSVCASISIGFSVGSSGASGSIGCAADGASPTFKYVVADEGPYDAEPSKVAMI